MPVFGPEAKGIGDGATNVLAIPVSGASGIVYSRSFKLAYGKYFAVSYKSTSLGVVNMKIEFEQSWVRPAAEGSQDNNWVEPESAADVIANLTDTKWHHESISPVAMPFMRFKITKASGNRAGNTLQIKFHMQEEL